jgi:hypothetical protein
VQGDVDCSYGQSGKVWFLAPPPSDAPFATRNCSVPTDKTLLIPVITLSCTTLDPPPFYGGNEQELRQCANSFGFSNLHAKIDGRRVHEIGRYATDSPLFEWVVPEDSVFGYPTGATGLGVANGVYLLVKPLSLGNHTIRFGGTYTDFGVSFGITYNLSVVPRRDSASSG